jgi:hypothetical protein
MHTKVVVLKIERYFTALYTQAIRQPDGYVDEASTESQYASSRCEAGFMSISLRQ